MSDEEKKDFTIIVGQDDHVIHEHHITYEHVVRLYLKDGGTTYNQYLIRYSKGPKQNPDGTLAPEQKVKIKDGMHFRVAGTGES